MTGSRALFVRVLLAARAHHRFEFKHLPGGFSDQLVASVRQEARVPKWFALFSHQEAVTWLQGYNRVEQRQAEGDIIRIGQDENLG